MKNKINYHNFVTSSINIFGNVWHINPKYLNEMLDSSYYYDNSHTNRKFAIRMIDSIFYDDDFFILINKNNYEKIINDIYKFTFEQDFSMYQYHSLAGCE